MVDATLTECRDPVEYLEMLGPDRRLRAFEDGGLSREELSVWAALHPEEVPLINGELPWIALTLE